MNFNTLKKCKHLVITKKKNILQTIYNLNGLGITEWCNNCVRSWCPHFLKAISSNDHIDHIDLVVSRANNILGLIYRTCTNECDQKSLLTLYKSLVRPQLRVRFTSLVTLYKRKVHGHGARSKTQNQIYFEVRLNLSWTFSEIRSFVSPF